MKSTLYPDWVMVGYRHNGRYRILASTALNKAELDYLARTYQFADVVDMVANLRPEYHLTADLKSYVIAEGNSYPEALSAILRDGWHMPASVEIPPSARPRMARGNVGPGHRMIEAEWDGSPQHAAAHESRGTEIRGDSG